MSDTTTGAQREATELAAKIERERQAVEDARAEAEAYTRVTAEYAAKLAPLAYALAKGRATEDQAHTAIRLADGIDWLEAKRQEWRQRENEAASRLQGLRTAYRDLTRCTGRAR